MEKIILESGTWEHDILVRIINIIGFYDTIELLKEKLLQENIKNSKNHDMIDKLTEIQKMYVT